MRNWFATLAMLPAFWPAAVLADEALINPYVDPPRCDFICFFTHGAPQEAQKPASDAKQVARAPARKTPRIAAASPARSYRATVARRVRHEHVATFEPQHVRRRPSVHALEAPAPEPALTREVPLSSDPKPEVAIAPPPVEQAPVPAAAAVAPPPRSPFGGLTPVDPQ